MRVAVFASGRGTNFENLLKNMVPSMEVVLLVTDKVCRALEIAARYSVDARTFLKQQYGSKEEMERAIAKVLDEHHIELIVLAGYMRLFSPWFVARYPKRIINIHPSLLPHYKGMHAIEQALADGRGIFGVTVHYVNEGMDEGEIIEQVRLQYQGHDLNELEALVHEAEYVLYPRVVRQLCEKRRQV
jgi:phosphoribosylglycinamide formyltransferase-1